MVNSTPRTPSSPGPGFITVSQRVDEIRPRIAQFLHLLLRLAFGPVIPPASPPLLILVLQQEIHQQAPAEQEYRQIGQHDAVACLIQGAVCRLVDVGGDGAVEVAPADDEAHCDAAFVDAFGVVRGPDDDVGYAGVDAQGAEKGAGVADSGGGSVCGWVNCQLDRFGWFVQNGERFEGRWRGTYPATSIEKPTIARIDV